MAIFYFFHHNCWLFLFFYFLFLSYFALPFWPNHMTYFFMIVSFLIFLIGFDILLHSNIIFMLNPFLLYFSFDFLSLGLILGLIPFFLLTPNLFYFLFKPLHFLFIFILINKSYNKINDEYFICFI